MTFGDDDCDLDGISLRTPEDAVEILRRQVIELCGGERPEKKHHRLCLLFAAISALTLRTATELRRQHPDAPPELLAASGDHALRLLVAAATAVALELFDLSIEEEMQDSWMAKFSRN